MQCWEESMQVHRLMHFMLAAAAPPALLVTGPARLLRQLGGTIWSMLAATVLDVLLMKVQHHQQHQQHQRLQLQLQLHGAPRPMVLPQQLD